MAENKNKIERIHDQMPRWLKTKQNPNWKALIETLGESDQKLADLVEEVRKQFFVNTASRPYIDRLAANVKVSRPKFVGMQDQDFRKYIPVLAYQPKQVKLVLDLLLDVFFFKDTTTAFTQSGTYETYSLEDGWELSYIVDQIHSERIIFKQSEFTDISAAKAEEIASIINRQAQHSFAIVFDDRIKKRKFVRLFTNTIGSKGSIQVIGGRADIALQFTGYNFDAGAVVGTQWLITKVGDTMTFQHIGGTSPNLNKVQVGDIAIIDIPGNSGSFVIQSIDLSNALFTFTNLFGTAGTYTHVAGTYVDFISPLKIVVYTNPTRSVVWEVSPGEIIIEMPASPPVVKRSLKGSAHLNGYVGTVLNRLSDTSLELDDASNWPLNGGKFVVQELSEIQTHIDTISEDIVINQIIENRFDVSKAYSYTSKSGNTLLGITPNLPVLADVYEFSIVSAIRTTDIVTITTSTAHGLSVGDCVKIQGVTPDIDSTINGTFIVSAVPSSTSFEYLSLGVAAASGSGLVRVERIGMSNSGSLAYLTSAQLDTGIIGPYMWDLNAPYVLSSYTSKIQADIKAGNNVRTLAISSGNNIPNEQSYAIFDYGTELEEGPVRILYKPTANALQLDPAYVFKNNHDIGSAVTIIRKKGAIVMSGTGNEYGAYITDPAVARALLQDLMRQVKSVGIFIDFLVRYPEQIYSVLDVYKSGNAELWPIGQQ